MKLPLLLFLSLAIFSSACQKAPVHLAESGDFQVVRRNEAQSLLTLIRENTEQVHSLQLLTKLKVKKSLREESLKQVVVFQRPDKLRLELFATNLNRLAALVVSRDEIIHALDTANKRVYIGPASFTGFDRLLGIPFLPEELMLWFAGRFKLGQRDVEVSLDSGSKRLLTQASIAESRRVAAIYELIEGEGTVITNVRGVTKGKGGNRFKVRLLSLQMSDSKGRPFFSSDFSYRQKAKKEIQLPERIEFTMLNQELEGSIFIEDAEVNPDLSQTQEKVFRAKIPSGAEVIDLNSTDVSSVPSLF